MRLLLIPFVVVVPLCGQETAPAWLEEKVDDALRGGRERVALGLLATEIEKAPAAPEALRLFVDVAQNVGEYDRADAAGTRWVAEHPSDTSAKMVRTRQLWRRGEHDAALEMVAPLLVAAAEREDAPKWNFPAVALAGEIHADRGERIRTEKLFDQLVTESARIILRDPKDLFALSSAVLFFGGKQGVNEGEKDLIAVQKAGGGPDADVALGWLYLERKYLVGGRRGGVRRLSRSGLRTSPR